ncbi:hypothetical protein EAL2_808p02960 (plasmid) [Peptoclostridium acidaminophilum DSM 3953]|uniref:DUF5698 domain-containing protein n=2 Tax=Peptoclostridium acidaminophilum TaxID=1731 RepID=W8UAH9_PEPAC|nr:hypothetical protein EAL2_808p02960 [Peptoclostridium acidaminophilum DSM 3953]
MINTMINLLIIFLLNVLGTCLGNLKTTFLAQKAIKPVYVTTFIDAIIFVYAFKLTTTSSGYGFVLAFAVGKMFGVFLGSKIEKKLAFGLFEIDVYKHPIPGKLLADNLRVQGYSVTTTLGYGIEGTERLILTIILPRNHFSDFHEMLKQHGNVNMSVKSISQTYGKVGGMNFAAE